MALQWRRRCISSSISFDTHLVHIRWFIGVIGLLNRPLSIVKSRKLILYLASAVMRWFPFMFKMYGSTHKDFFTNEYVRSLLELSLSCLHRCVNILTIESLKESMNLFVLPMCCVSQAWSSPVSSCPVSCGIACHQRSCWMIIFIADVDTFSFGISTILPLASAEKEANVDTA